MQVKSRNLQMFIASVFIFAAGLRAEVDGDIKYYIIRLDDVGMNHSVNMAVRKVIESGLPVSVSVMFVCPWYQEAVEILKNQPQASVGVHLTLNAEWSNYRWGPVLGSAAVPSLVDDVGYFLPARSILFDKDPDVREIEQELRAQIQRALKSGLRIDYLDYHMGAAVQTTELRGIVEKLAAEYDLSLMYYFGEEASSNTYAAAFENKLDSLLSNVRSIGPGINLQILHVAMDTPEMRALHDLNASGLEDVSLHRASELDALLSPDFRKALVANNIKPITYAELIEIVGRENMSRPSFEDY